MRRILFLSGALALVTSSLPAQAVRWNDRPTSNWEDDAPRVRVWFEGARGVAYGSPMRVRFEVDEDAYVTVVRVDDDGRMTILFPYSRNQRAAVRGGQIHYVRNPRIGGGGEFSFIATDRMSGYVFALASYTPLDFSVFENRDYDRVGGYSRFTLANRSIARRPDVFIDRFAAAVLWDVNTPYDYDVDYYHPVGYPGTFNTYAMCAPSAFGNFIGWRTYIAQFSSWDRMAYRYSFMCNEWYNRLHCFSWMAFSNNWGCYNNGLRIANRWPTPVGGQPGDPSTGDTASVPNEDVIRGGLFTPTPVPVPVEGGPDAPPVERLAGRFDQVRAGESDLDNVLSIPPRVTRKMKEEDARRDNARGASPAGTTFDRSNATTGKAAKGSEVADAPTRVQPPSREPTKAKGTSEPRRATTPNRGFGSTGRTSEPRSTGRDRDRVSRPADTRTTGSSNPPSIKGATTTEKKKPPQD